jgi:serine/threonine protein kinase
MPTHRSIDRTTFLGYLRQSGLVAEEDLARLLPELPDTNRGRLLARDLVARGVLTRFQAERLLAGRTAGFVLGPYSVLDEIGRGGMGRVYRAEHRTMRRIVALKVLAPEVLSDARALHLFLREVRAVAQLVHPNIVTAYDANEVNGRHYLVLEYVDGPNLEQLVRQQGPLPVGAACDYIRQAANGLQCAHQLGMVHRDIKPANILVQRRGQDDTLPGLVKISDFGLARLSTRDARRPGHSAPGTILTRDNTVMGTPDYLSPEQSRDLHQTDIRSDLYSLGCTFYFLLAGRPPFPGGSTVDKLIRHSTEVPDPVTHFRADVPPDVQDILERLLAKQPADRFQTPAELAAALEPYAVSGPIPWAPPPADLPADSSAGLAASSELAALADTLPGDIAPTPLASGEQSSPTGRRGLKAALLGIIALIRGTPGSGGTPGSQTRPGL